MFDRDSWLEIANTVLSNPLRTGLTGLSIALGIFILVVMQGLGSGLENGVQSTFGDRASNLIEVRTGSNRRKVRQCEGFGGKQESHSDRISGSERFISKRDKA